MGTLAVTYNGTTKNYTLTGAPAVAYGGSTRLSASGWSGTRVLKCANKLMSTDVTIGSLKLPTKGTLAKTDIKLICTLAPASISKITTPVTTSTTYTVPSGSYNRIQFFAVGGGGGPIEPGEYYAAGGGGGGGYTKTSSVMTTSAGTKYTIVIGAGGTAADGGTTSVKNSSGTTLVSAAGGKSAKGTRYAARQSVALTGCAGGSGGGGGFSQIDPNSTYGASSLSALRNGGSNGSGGAQGRVVPPSSTTLSYQNVPGGTGQGTSTTFDGIAYAGGGGGGTTTSYLGVGVDSTMAGKAPGGTSGGGAGAYSSKNSRSAQTSGTAGTGGGGGGISHWRATGLTKSSGGSGVVVIKIWEA